MEWMGWVYFLRDLTVGRCTGLWWGCLDVDFAIGYTNHFLVYYMFWKRVSPVCFAPQISCDTQEIQSGNPAVAPTPSHPTNLSCRHPNMQVPYASNSSSITPMVMSVLSNDHFRQTLQTPTPVSTLQKRGTHIPRPWPYPNKSDGLSSKSCLPRATVAVSIETFGFLPSEDDRPLTDCRMPFLLGCSACAGGVVASVSESRLLPLPMVSCARDGP